MNSNGRGGISRRWTRLIYADWIPQANGIVGSLPLSNNRDQDSTCLGNSSRILRTSQKTSPAVAVHSSPILIRLRMHCSPQAIFPVMAPQMNPDSSRATAVTAT